MSYLDHTSSHHLLTALYKAIQTYLSVPILNELLTRIENNCASYAATDALAAGILSYFYSPDDGFSVLADRIPDPRIPDTTVFRVTRYRPARRDFADHLIVAATVSHNEGNRLLVLHGEVTASAAHFVRDQAIGFFGPFMIFYAYHDFLETFLTNYVEPSHVPGDQDLYYCLHLRHDAETVHEVLAFISTMDEQSLIDAEPWSDDDGSLSSEE